MWENWYDNSASDNVSVGKRRERHVALSLSGHDNGVWGLQYDEVRDEIITHVMRASRAERLTIVMLGL